MPKVTHKSKQYLIVFKVKEESTYKIIQGDKKKIHNSFPEQLHSDDVME